MGKPTSIVLELQREALDSNTRICDLLRKAAVVAKKLRVADFEKWVNQELNGYRGGEDVPEYRQLRTEIKAWNPYHGWIPVIFADDLSSMKDFPNSVRMGQIEELLRSDSPFFTTPLPARVAQYIMEEAGLPLVPSRHIGRSQLASIVDAVRTRVLDWTVPLEQAGILGEGMTFSDEEKRKAAAVQSIHISGNFQGNIGNIEHSTVSQRLEMRVAKGDFLSLAAELKSRGITAADLQELKAAIENDGQPTGTFGERVGLWIGKMVSKAATGAWSIGVDVAGSVLASAIAKYYGFC